MGCTLASHRKVCAFTLVELLVVLGVIMVLVAITLGVVNRVHEQSNAVICQNHQRILWHAVLAFALDNDGHVVGNCFDYDNPIPSRRDFLMGATYVPSTGTGDWTQAPQAGTLWKYVKNPDVYLCPERTKDSTVGTTLASDLTSNGHFDYAIFLVFTGAKLQNLPTNTQFTDPAGHVSQIPTPYLVEEQPWTINGDQGYIEGGHDMGDQLAHIHFGGSYYLATDGSCQFFIEPSTCCCFNYASVSPRQQLTPLWNWSPDACKWGLWDTQ